MKIHASQVNTYQVCPRTYYFRYIENLLPNVDSPKLLFGSGVHLGLAEYYRNGATAAIDTYKTWLTEQEMLLQGTDAPPESLKEAAKLGEVLLNEYINYAKHHDNFTPIAIEQQFSVPLWTDTGELTTHQHEGTVDGIVRDTHGALCLMEHKTARDNPSELDLQLNTQISYYLLALQQLFDEPIQGVIYNVIRKVNPARAKTPVIFRRRISRTATELLNTRAQLYRTVERMLSDKHHDPQPGQHCGWRCAYKQLCLCMQDGTDYSLLASQMYHVKETVGEVLPEDEEN